MCGLLLTALHYANQTPVMLEDYVQDQTQLASIITPEISDVPSPFQVSGEEDWSASHGPPSLNHLPVLQHIDSDMGTVTAVLPVTIGNIGNLHNITQPLISEDSSVAAIIFVCHAELLSALNAIYLGESATSFLDISVSIWPEGFQEDKAVISAATGTRTDYILLLSSSGMVGLDSKMQMRLLSHPVLLDLPVGVCGVVDNEGRASRCVSPTAEPQPVSFLVPPMVLPAAILKGYNATADTSYNPWKELANALTSDNNIGGYVQQGDSHISSWCSIHCESIKGSLSVSQGIHSTSATETSFVSSSIAIILPTVQNLEDFSNAACRLLRNGIRMHVLILSHNAHHFSQRNSSYPWLHDNLISRRCQIPYSALHESHNEFANAEAASYWLDASKVSHSSILIGISSKQLSALDVDLERRRMGGTTIIKIPIHDLPFTDWIGSLTEMELSSEPS